MIMNIKTFPAIEHPELIASTTFDAIKKLPDGKDIEVFEIDPNLSDTSAFCEKYGFAPEITANCVIVESKRGENRQLVACLILATTRADVNGLLRKTLDARKASFASMETAVTESQMEYGAINPIGLPETWQIFIDSKIVDLPQVIIGSGIRKSKILIPGKILPTIPNVRILENLGVTKTA